MKMLNNIYINTSTVTKSKFYHINKKNPMKGFLISGRRDSNPQQSAWKAETLAN